MAAPVLRIENLAKNFGGLRVTDEVTLVKFEEDK